LPSAALKGGIRSLTVSFAGHGTKKLVERFANLPGPESCKVA